ncbi:MAG: glycoside hydrolase family 18 protein [Polyangiaceae bacterium]|nr:glycoside hydrolase family 18 protein [Polyangiaceae bacterium]
MFRRASAVLPIALLAASCTPPQQSSTGDGGQSTSSSDGGGGSAGDGGAATSGSGGTSQTGSGGSTGSTGPTGSTGGAGSGGSTGSTGSGGSTPTDKRVIGYFAAWAVYGRDYHVPEIPADKLTHINYAFANISDQGECVLGDAYADTDKYYPGDSWDPGAKRGSFHQLEILKANHPGLRTLISIGGWSWSGKFSDVALTDSTRQKFVTSCVNFMKDWGFDGIDIDWEYPVGGGLPENKTRPEDKQNYTLLLQAFRDALNAEEAQTGKVFDLTIAAPAGPGIYKNIELQKVGSILSWINLMTYDLHGGWDTHTNFNSALYPAQGDPSADPEVKAKFNTSQAVEGYLAAGVPASKIVVGVPFYGRGYSNVPNQNHGLFQTFSGLPQGTWEAGIFDYHDLAKNYVPTMTRYLHDEAKVPWLYNPATGVMISYDDPESMQIKADYIVQKNLGGAMFWELSGDTQDSALLSALHSTLTSN